MAKSGQLSVVQRSPRPGEGAIVEVARRQVTNPDGSTGLELGLDLAVAPVPEKRYIADIVSLTFEDGVVQMLFGQRKITRSAALRSLVVIQMTSTATAQFIKTLIGFEPTARKWLEENDIHWKLGTIEEEPEQTVTLFANIIGLAFAGREACMDFYHASAFSLHQVQQNRKMAVEPVVRVILASGLLLSLIDKLHEIEPTLPKERDQSHE
jgi:hypothetical protein